MKRGLGSGRNKPVVVAEPGQLVTGTEEQEAVWDVLLHGSVHVIVEAVAGSGKTFTLVQYAMREKYKRIGLVAFNKHIADELKQRMGGQRNVDCMTYHSLGFRAIREHLGRTQVDDYKVLSYLDTVEMFRVEKGVKQLLSKEDQKVARYRVATLVGLAKGYGYGPEVTQAELDWIEDRHDVELNGLKDIVCANVGPTLKYCMENTATIDFNDMVWLPYILKLPVPTYDVLCVDEYQDTAVTQQWLALQAGKRLCAVGDPRQAIYAFRGADSKGFDRLRDTLGEQVVTLPLTLTRRCPKSHVKLAQTIVPQIRAMDDAPEGLISYPSAEQAVGMLAPGDLVVCRVNAPLLSVAYGLLKRGVRAVVRGRDIGIGISKLIEAARKDLGMDEKDLGLILGKASEITNKLVAKLTALPNGKGEMRAAAAQDKLDCLLELGSQCDDLYALQGLLARLFDEVDDGGVPKNAVVLGTVHRTKGLEGNRVFVLRPDLIPHPMAKKAADQEQERNLAYVAVTRAKFEEGKVAELLFVGGSCELFAAVEPMDACPHLDFDENQDGDMTCRDCGEVKLAEPEPEEPEQDAHTGEWSL